MMIRACQSPPVNRSQPLLTPEPSPKDDKHRIGEVAGGTAAECAAICCCCPCGLMNLLLLAVYKVPKGLCKKALKKRKRQKVMKKKKLLQQQHHHEQKSGPTHRYDESEEESDQSEALGREWQATMKLEFDPGRMRRG
ncbi:hypothetical protein F0562_001805 [Nyssa sinensis]|uniref:Uncharacterized protein n=1 Tax=Nyssa sinensis TaxID=561372 RepID=A0A5J5C959_9ASTE|nr:hypothetical protein F0562_001805 [Nyssa sinensis]